MVENTFANNAYLVDGFAFAVYDFWHTPGVDSGDDQYVRTPGLHRGESVIAPVLPQG